MKIRKLQLAVYVNRLRFPVSVAATVLIAACGSSPVAPGEDHSITQLRAAPTSVNVGGVSLRLTPLVWRDFQPISPPDGKPMIVALRVTTGGSAFPPGVTAPRAWVLFEEGVWPAIISEEVPYAPGGPMREWVIRNGPKWGPNVYVDVIIELVTGPSTAFLLLARNQLVARTD
jgi:hypothetical protein